MKHVALFLLGLMLVSTVACQSKTPKPNKKVPVGPMDSSSGLPWSRPQKFESNGGMGGAVPQSR